MNTLITSGKNIQLSQTKSYTLLDDEVYVNNNICKKKDIEISINGNHPNANPLDVNVGIEYRSSFQGTPANLLNYKNWFINGVQATSLAYLVETINTEIK